MGASWILLDRLAPGSMRRLATFVALLVLSLSRFGVTAPEPARAPAWSESGHVREPYTPAVRFAVDLREAAPRVPPRATSPWLPLQGAQLVRLAGPITRLADRPWPVEHSSLGAWPRVTYDATAPPRLS
jgi:hypothetical protein